MSCRVGILDHCGMQMSPLEYRQIEKDYGQDNVEARSRGQQRVLMLSRMLTHVLSQHTTSYSGTGKRPDQKSCLSLKSTGWPAHGRVLQSESPNGRNRQDVILNCVESKAGRLSTMLC